MNTHNKEMEKKKKNILSNATSGLMPLKFFIRNYQLFEWYL